jgi:hypothetical protein
LSAFWPVPPASLKRLTNPIDRHERTTDRHVILRSSRLLEEVEMYGRKLHRVRLLVEWLITAGPRE